MKSFATLCLLGCAVAVQLCNEGLTQGDKQEIAEKIEQFVDNNDVPDAAVDAVGDLIEKKCRGRKNRDDDDDDDNEEDNRENKRGEDKKSRKGGKGDRESGEGENRPAKEEGDKEEEGEDRPPKQGLAQKDGEETDE